MALSNMNFATIFALQSRLLVFLTQFIFNLLVPDHDAGVFDPPNIHPQNYADKAVNFLLGGFCRWDALHFHHIAEHGYTYEHSLAFFPLFPFLLRFLSDSLFMPLQLIMNYSSVLRVSGFSLNIFSFVLAANFLHTLAQKVLNSDKLAVKVVQLFCLNPASIFFSAGYTESTFAMFTFAGLINVENDRHFLASICFALSGATRSNGFINLGFIAYAKVHHAFSDITVAILQSKANRSRISLCVDCSKIFIRAVTGGVLCAVVVLTPFALYQCYSAMVFCDSDVSLKDIPQHLIDLANSKDYKMPHMGVPVWCKSALRTSYWYVQATYWQVGFMAYYQLKQIPNFLLALPMIIIGSMAVVTYTRQNLKHCLTLGLLRTPPTDNTKKTDDPTSENSHSVGYLGTQIFVYVVHMLAMLIFGVFFMNVQVVTRFICSSCPAFYFFVAWKISDPSNACREKIESNEKADHSDLACENLPTEDKSGLNSVMDWEDKPLNRAIYTYFLFYFFVGIASFVNFLPWT